MKGIYNNSKISMLGWVRGERSIVYMYTYVLEVWGFPFNMAENIDNYSMMGCINGGNEYENVPFSDNFSGIILFFALNFWRVDESTHLSVCCLW